MEFDKEKFSEAVKQKRLKMDMDLRSAATDSKVYFTTLHRIEKGKVPDVNTFIKLLQWLKKGYKDFIK